ncbi:hypothetical protein KM043_012230 [Ampulex compressa]|nr:hypothetical protein KM043_012230 [Ampulex compressa]
MRGKSSAGVPGFPSPFRGPNGPTIEAPGSAANPGPDETGLPNEIASADAAPLDFQRRETRAVFLGGRRSKEVRAPAEPKGQRAEPPSEGRDRDCPGWAGRGAVGGASAGSTADR